MLRWDSMLTLFGALGYFMLLRCLLHKELVLCSNDCH